jgi:N-acetylglucosaminyldiphosphoundecaprenol N-acetyl-beta-D-mannosaminyltransferase
VSEAVAVRKGETRIGLRELPIASLTLEQTLDHVDAVITTCGRLRIGVVNAAKIVRMGGDTLLRQDVLSSDLVLADGASVVWALRLLGRPLPERVAGIDLMTGILRRGNERGYRVYCLGATQEVLDIVCTRIARDYPGVVIAGARNGYYDEAEEEAVAAGIDTAQPDVLFVAITSPRKERFLARWGDRLDVRVWHGVGGSFDVLAGKVRRAPLLWQRLGLEWFYRLLQEPRRLWKRYLVTNTAFCAMVIREALHAPPRRPPVAGGRGTGSPPPSK